ncbi:uncharacterized protein LOC131010509 [Salvia miltiorrhiza]|uniref:uncharacterized protein LOC131010509 n=1 Tax=Salvia miltiorrhiza TaxID=226208 RepID=UPI0025AC4561|nr:uncharacterized protein LOC131010509 [Salvia miltiorrhiza]
MEKEETRLFGKRSKGAATSIAWKVGDGERIRIGKDCWIPDGKGNFSTACVQDRWKDLKVGELFSEAEVSWDTNKLAEIMPRKEIWKFSGSLRINMANPDRPFWPSGRCNSYSVKSGYLLAVSLRSREEASSSHVLTGLWNWIWGLEVIPKVKIFMWKCLSGIFPTTRALMARSIEVDPVCCRCGEEVESSEHALRDCPWMVFLWEISPLRLRPLSAAEIWNVKDWFEQIRSIPDKEVHATFATTAWASWYARNLLLYQNKNLTHIECSMVAQKAKWKRSASSSSIISQPRSISCSRDSQVRIQCDAAIGEGVGIGFGAAMFDVDNGLLGVRWGFTPGVFTAEEGEARAILESLQLCEEKGRGDAILETDCQTLYWKLINREEDLSTLGDTLNEIFLRTDSMQQISWSWTSRANTFVVDRLAKHALCLRSRFTSSDGFPSVLNSSELVE